MQIFYDEKNVCIKITIDYCDVEAMNRLCEVITECENDYDLWQIDGIYLNHTLDEKDMFEAQKRLEKLFSKKGKNMSVTEASGKFTKDYIILTRKELVNYFADFSIYYMQIIIRLQNGSTDIIEFGTESDSTYVYVKKKNNNNTSILKILQYVGIEKLKSLTCEKCELIWNDDIFENIGERYPELGAYIANKILELKENGWIKVEEYIKTHYWKKEKKLIYRFLKSSEATIEIPILKIQCQYIKSALVIILM